MTHIRLSATFTLDRHKQLPFATEVRIDAARKKSERVSVAVCCLDDLSQERRSNTWLRKNPDRTSALCQYPSGDPILKAP